ncbi:MAG: histidine phosphatase family protein [Bacteroidales bacterium]
MKTLYIVRHAKSDWSQPGQKDSDRILLPKGIKRTERILVYLNRKEIIPDLIICSHAVRAMETARLIARGLGYPVENIQIDKTIYASDEDQILDVIYGVSDDINSLLIVGHNPEFTNLSNLFTDNPIEWLPTSGVVSVSFDTKRWNQINTAGRTTNFFIYPKALK